MAILLVACGSEATLPMPRTVQLPSIGTVGDLPPPADTVTLTVHANGRMMRGEQHLDLDRLASLLRAEVSARAKHHLYGSQEESTLNLLLEVDRDLPTGALSPLCRLLTQPEISVHRVFFEVNAEGDTDGGEVGAIAWFLPFDVGGNVPRFLTRQEVVTVGRHSRSSNPADLYYQLRETLDSTTEGQKDAALIIDAAADIPFGFVLRVADAAFRAGIHALFLGGDDLAWSYAHMAGGPNGLDAIVAAIPAPNGELGIQLADRLLDRAGEPMPPTARTRGSYAGLPESLRSLPETLPKAK